MVTPLYGRSTLRFFIPLLKAKQKENGDAKPCLIEEVGGDEL
jgi:hypothetical protein